MTAGDSISAVRPRNHIPTTHITFIFKQPTYMKTFDNLTRLALKSVWHFMWWILRIVSCFSITAYNLVIIHSIPFNVIINTSAEVTQQLTIQRVVLCCLKVQLKKFTQTNDKRLQLPVTSLHFRRISTHLTPLRRLTPNAVSWSAPVCTFCLFCLVLRVDHGSHNATIPVSPFAHFTSRIARCQWS
jgi:hypothetical protein